MKIFPANATSRVIRLLAVLALLPAAARAADAHTSGPSKGAKANQEVAYDESTMRPRDDAKVRGTSYEPVEYDDATMRPRDRKANATQAKAVEQVDYDESRMRPRK
jgi:cell division septation protein DedD